MAELTSKQEAFCQNIAIKGMNQSDALRDAYDYDNASNETINKKACDMMRESNIRGRVEELREKKECAIIKEAVYDYKEHMKELNLISERAWGETDGDAKMLNTVLKAAELKGKVSELYNFIQKKDITSKGESVFQTVTQERIAELAKNAK